MRGISEARSLALLILPFLTELQDKSRVSGGEHGGRREEERHFGSGFEFVQLVFVLHTRRFGHFVVDKSSIEWALMHLILYMT
jgi:hypothetical protein